MRGRRRAGGRHTGVPGIALLLALTASPGVAGTPAAAADPRPLPDLHLVTLTGPGTSADDDRAGAADEAALLARQDAVLAAAGIGEVTYRWTTALNGFAAHLTPEQVDRLEADPSVALVEPNSVVTMAGSTSRAPLGAVGTGPHRGGAGTVIGFVDSGLDPDSPLFAEVPRLGRAPRDFAGECVGGDDWGPETCDRKLVGSGWWVHGFGADRVRATESLSPRDQVGHGTAVASIAAGNSGVSVRVAGRDAGVYSGLAPQARIATYKSCWAAPDPADDGCATADVVSAIDRATADGVDVLSLAIAGPDRLDTVELALLGAAESDVVVVAAAGNAADTAYAAHGSPWVTTVGSAQGPTRRGVVSAAGGPRLLGASRIRHDVGPVRVLRATDVAARGARLADAAQCRPGSLDAQRAAGAVVVCRRGGIGRVDKSTAVEQADGVGMVLANVRRGAVHDDFHSIPTVHVSATAARQLLRWMRTHPRGRVRLAAARPDHAARRTVATSAAGDPRAGVLKPDVVARGQGVLAATTGPAGVGWSLFSGTSAATARVAGLAAVLRGQHRWPASVVRSALVTGAVPLRGESTLRQGGGELRSVPRPRLALDVRPSSWRRALEAGSWRDLNTPSLVFRGTGRTLTRRVTNLGSRAEYFSVSAQGFPRTSVRVTPLALRLRPGQTGTFRVHAAGAGPLATDSGWVVWRGARGSVLRIPVALTRR
ncbi:S8 family serine peptidase [Nocardioides gansuensis]|uniref:S8 family serine peptidase n=1 Tax=Nocardioides gansuensis TaxID=2138300 RepID=UPI0014029E41|nr:S8 family serine peptidase [Nocardioides gansuensis]